MDSIRNKYNTFVEQLTEEVRDPYGTRISVGYNTDTSVNVYVKEPNSERKKMIGEVILTKSGVVVYRKQEKEKDKHRNTLSWTVHKWIFKYVDYILYKTKLGVYKISSEKARDVGFTMSYKTNNQGYMTKQFVKCKDWEFTPFNKSEVPILKKLGYEWYNCLRGEFKKPYMINMGRDIASRRNKISVFPESKDVFNAYKKTPYMDVKVVILGDYPYPNKSADGLAFSQKEDFTTPSEKLKGIHTELEQDYYNGGLMLGAETNLEHWANQGVMLLNTVLTSEQTSEKAHKEHKWQNFISHTLNMLINRPTNSKKPIVFLLWGEKAINFEKLLLDNKENLILKTESPNRNGYLGSKHFTKCNSFLISTNQLPVSW